MDGAGRGKDLKHITVQIMKVKCKINENARIYGDAKQYRRKQVTCTHNGGKMACRNRQAGLQIHLHRQPRES